MPQDDVAQRVWSEWEKLDFEESSPVTTIAAALNMTTAAVAAILFPGYDWDDSQDPMPPINPDGNKSGPEWIYQVYGLTTSREVAEADAATLRNPVGLERERRLQWAQRPHAPVMVDESPYR